MYLQYSIFKPAGRTVSICVIAEGKALVILLWQSCNWFAFGIMAVYVIRSSPSDVEFDILMNLGKVWHCSHWCKNNPASLVASSAGALRRNGSLGNTHASSMHQAMSQTQSQRYAAFSSVTCSGTSRMCSYLEWKCSMGTGNKNARLQQSTARAFWAWCCIKASYMFAFNHSYLMLRIWNCTLDHCTPRRMHDKEHIQTWQRKLSPATRAQLTK